MTIAVGERIPEATFPYVPYAPALDDLVSGANPSLSRSRSDRSDRLGCLWIGYVLSLNPLVIKITL